MTAFLIPTATLAATTCPDADGDGYYADCAEADLPTIGAKGSEKASCDCITISEDAEPACTGYDEVVAPGKSIKGKNVHPGAIDTPSNGIDENCDGEDGVYVKDGDGKTIDDYIGMIVKFLGYIVAGVSTAILIWGGIMYASAAGEEEKTRKARKAMIGALVGVIIGVLASTLIETVINYVTQ